MSVPLTSTFVIDDVDGGDAADVLSRHVIMTPGGRLRVYWKGPATDPVVLLRNSRDVTFEHLDVVCETPCEAVFVSERTKKGDGVIPSTHHQFRDVRVYGNKLAPVGFWARPTIDENNEHMTFDAVSVYGCGIGFCFEGQQSKEHRLEGVRVEGATTAVEASSSFTMIGGTIAVCVTGIHLPRVGDPVLIEGTGFEACTRLLVTGMSTAARPVTLIGVRYAADQLLDDLEMIVFRDAGPLNLTGCTFGDGVQKIPRIAMRGHGPQSVTISGNKFGSFGADKVCPIKVVTPATPAVTWGRNTYNRYNGADPNTTSRITWAAANYV